MIREFGTIDALYLIAAVRWTLLLTLVGFAGGALIGIVIAVMRISGVIALQTAAICYIQVI